MSDMADLVRVLTAATGNSTPITLGVAYSQLFMTTAEAACVDGRTYTWLIVDGNNWELVKGVYTASGTTAARTTVLASRSGGTLSTSRISLSGTAQVRIVAAAEDMGGVRGTRPVTTTTDTIANTDLNRPITYNNASAIAVSLAQAGASTMFLDGWATWIRNIGAGTVTITPATSTINGAATLVIPTKQGAFIWSDGTNYHAFVLPVSAALLAVNNLSDLASATTARTNLGATTVGAAVFTATDAPTARAAVYAAPFDALAYSGMQINGSVDVSQELLTTGATLASGTAKYIADGIQAQYTNSAAVVTSAQVTSASFSFPLPGYSNGHRIQAPNALTSMANGDCALHRWIFEGYRIARLGFGATGAQPFSYGIQFFAAATGVIFLKFSNSNYSRCYYQEQTVAFGWNWLTGTVPGDTTGTWQTTNSVGMYVEVYAAGKAASPVSPGSWGSTNTTQTTNSTNQLGVNGAATVATGLIVVPGSEVPSAARAPFIMRPFDQELDLCLPQFQKSYPLGTKPGTSFGAGGSTYLMIGNTGNLGQIFGLQKRLLGTGALTIYDNAGTANKVSYYNGAWNNGGSIGATSLFDTVFWINSVITGMTVANFDFVVNARL